MYSSPLLGQATQPSPTPSGLEPNEPNTPSPTALVPTATAEAIAQLNAEELQTRKKQATEQPGLTEELKAKLAEAYDKALAQFKLAEELASKRRQYAQTTKDAPTALAKIKETLAQPAATTLPAVAPDLTLTQAEQMLTQATVDLEDARKKAAELENEPKRRADRRTKVPEESNVLRQQLAEIQKKLAAPPVQEQQTTLTEANQILLQLQQRVAEARLAANTEELLFYDATNDLLAAQRDQAARRVAAQEKLVTFWQEKVGTLRQQAAQEARKEAAQAQRETRSAHPIIQEIAKKNTELADLQTKLVAEIQQLGSYSETVAAKLKTTQEELEEIRQQIDTAGGVTGAMGMLLLGERDKLPDVGQYEQQIRNRAEEIASAQLSGMEYDKKWSQLSDLTDEMEQIDAELESSLSPEQREALKKEAAGYYDSQRKTLRALSDLYWDKATRLAKLDINERSLVETIENFDNFIDANVLWVKSSPAFRLSDLDRLLRVFGWLVTPANWQTVGRALWSDFAANAVAYLAIFVIIVATASVGPKLRRQMGAISEEVRQIQTDNFVLTARAFLLTTVLAAWGPVCLLLISWRLAAASIDDFVLALASGSRELAVLLFIFNFLRCLTMPHGLAQDHFRQREETLTFLRRHLRWLSAVVLPAVFVLGAMRGVQATQEWYATAGRLVFMAGLVAEAVFYLIVLRPSSAFVEPYLKLKRDSWLTRLRFLWYPLSMLLPLATAVLAGTGYFYGARHLNARLVFTIGLILLILLVRATFVRCLTVAQRRLALLEREKRQAAAEKAAQEATDPSATTPSATPTEAKVKPEPTIFEISQQTRRLIGVVTTILLIVGLWAIWDDVLPALAKLGEHELYKVGEDVIMLGEIVTALVVTVLTVVVARNVPGLLEIIVLRRLPLDRGVRFAIITICRYVLVVIGIVWAFSEIGIGWAKVQWLIAAMTVGLGFGLQEIFANFVSGLIILFEQPIRVDDVVTVGDVTGRVSMIRIRATTIRRWDQRELIVPNKEFITGQLINWTLTDSILRRDFPVGIAYGSDIRKAEKLLYEIAENDPRVLKDPPPTVLFKGFGDNSLDFELRVNYAGIENSLPIWHDINVAIDDRFREADIEIAFPQRDVHVRTIDLDIPLHLKQGSPPPTEPTP